MDGSLSQVTYKCYLEVAPTSSRGGLAWPSWPGSSYEPETRHQEEEKSKKVAEKQAIHDVKVKPQTPNTKHETRNPKPKTRNLKPKTRNPNSESRTLNPESRIPKPQTPDPNAQTKKVAVAAKAKLRFMAEQRPEIQKPKTETRNQKTPQPETRA